MLQLLCLSTLSILRLPSFQRLDGLAARSFAPIFRYGELGGEALTVIITFLKLRTEGGNFALKGSNLEKNGFHWINIRQLV